MKKIFKIIGESLGHMLSYIWSPQFAELFAAFISHVYTGWLKSKFENIGCNTIISYPLYNLRGSKQIRIGNNTQIESLAQLTVWSNHGKINIGNNCLFRNGIHISATDTLTIGDNVLTGANVLITDNAHGKSNVMDLELAPLKRSIYSKGKVSIGDNVWIGNNACILAGVTIGQGAVIGCNAVVTHDIPEYSIAAGVPAKVINKIK